MTEIAGVSIIPVLHGDPFFAREVRKQLLDKKFSAVVVDLPAPFERDLSEAIDKLPDIYAVCAQHIDESLFYIPCDPCDGAIEAIRQSRAQRIACIFGGWPVLTALKPHPPLPDSWAIEKVGFDAYAAISTFACSLDTGITTPTQEAAFLAQKIIHARDTHTSVCAVIHATHVAAVAHALLQESTHNAQFDTAPPYVITTYAVNPDHLYFALGQLPFVTAKFEQERFDPLAQAVDIRDCIKDLYRESRDTQGETPGDAGTLSPQRIRIALAFLRNLTVQDGRFLPSLFDIVESAKGVGGNAYALRVLKNARYYPYLPTQELGNFIDISIESVKTPHSVEPLEAINLLRDKPIYWRRLSLRPDPTKLQKRKYRYQWNPHGFCSHVPEDRRIEQFNDCVRSKAIRAMTEDCIKSEKFTASVKDGIDFRETVRRFYTGSVYVKEVPPSRGGIDTVIIIFDGSHDELYPHYATWYAEHQEESTLSFYATEPFADLIGPGVARARYGGLGLIFPPRHIPDIFSLPVPLEYPTLPERLAWGCLSFAEEPAVAFVSAHKPSMRIQQLARTVKKRLVWIPLASFSSETINRLRRFHVLNGTTVRSWAAHFIPD